MCPLQCFSQPNNIISGQSCAFPKSWLVGQILEMLTNPTFDKKFYWTTREEGGDFVENMFRITCKIKLQVILSRSQTSDLGVAT